MTRLKGLLEQIMRQSPLRNVAQDPGEWDQCVHYARSVDYPNRLPLLALYERASRDAAITSALDQRRKKLLSQPFRVVNAAGQEVADLTKELDHRLTRRFMALVLDSVFYGHSLIELGINEQGLQRVELVPREHVRPIPGEWVVNRLDRTGTPYRGLVPRLPGIALVEVGEPEDLGLLLTLSRCFLIKKGVEGAWAEFAEVFGIPMRIVKLTDVNDPELRKEIEEQLQNQGGAAYAISDMRFDIDVKESGKQDAHHVFSELISYQDEQISKVVNGQTLTSDAGRHGSRALGEVHSATAAYYTDADKRLVTNEINAKLLPLLAQVDARWAGVSFGFRKYEEMPQAQRVQAYKDLATLGYRPLRAQLEAELGIELEELPSGPVGVAATGSTAAADEQVA
jgi:phage gp29-like protein